MSIATLDRRLALTLLLGFTAACVSSRPPSRPSSGAAESLPIFPSAWSEEGVASWYGGDDGFEGKPTASGEIYDSSLLTAAHRELPLGSLVEVWNPENGKRVQVRINDRGPFMKGRIIDLSRAAAGRLDLIGSGTGRVRLMVLKLGIEAPPVSPSGLWAIQIGSFADPANARRQAERARATGHSVSLEPYSGLTRVKVGAYGSRGEAQEVLAALEQQGFEGIVVPAR